MAPGTRLDAAEIEELTAPSAERKAWSLADALVAGEADAGDAHLSGAARAGRARARSAVLDGAAAPQRRTRSRAALDAGEPAAQIKRKLRMPSRAADRLIADARRGGADKLRRAIEEIADLELASRGGGAGAASEDTVALLAIQRIAA